MRRELRLVSSFCIALALTSMSAFAQSLSVEVFSCVGKMLSTTGESNQIVVLGFSNPDVSNPPVHLEIYQGNGAMLGRSIGGGLLTNRSDLTLQLTSGHMMSGKVTMVSESDRTFDLSEMGGGWNGEKMHVSGTLSCGYSTNGNLNF